MLGVKLGDSCLQVEPECPRLCPLCHNMITLSAFSPAASCGVFWSNGVGITASSYPTVGLFQIITMQDCSLSTKCLTCMSATLK